MKKLPLAATLFVVGAMGLVAAFASLGHAARFGANGSSVIFILTLVSLSFWMAAFLLFLSWRDGSRKSSTVKRAAREEVLQEATGVYALRPGITYRVLRPFADCYGNRFMAGETLTFQGRNFIPYHGGHTLIFTPRTIYLQEELSAEILAEFEKYMAPVTPVR